MRIFVKNLLKQLFINSNSVFIKNHTSKNILTREELINLNIYEKKFIKKKHLSY
jgi:hypothetical protein